MDKSQQTILKKIFKKNNIKNNAKFIQYRNLKEFRYFILERVNPNHIIELYGKLKGENRNIHVGKIIIPYTTIIFFLNYFSPIQIINSLLLISSLMLLSICIFYIIDSVNIVRLIYDSINRRYSWSGKFRFWENSILDS